MSVFTYLCHLVSSPVPAKQRSKASSPFHLSPGAWIAVGTLSRSCVFACGCSSISPVSDWCGSLGAALQGEQHRSSPGARPASTARCCLHFSVVQTHACQMPAHWALGHSPVLCSPSKSIKWYHINKIWARTLYKPPACIEIWFNQHTLIVSITTAALSCFL